MKLVDYRNSTRNTQGKSLKLQGRLVGHKKSYGVMDIAMQGPASVNNGRLLMLHGGELLHTTFHPATEATLSRLNKRWILKQTQRLLQNGGEPCW